MCTALLRAQVSTDSTLSERIEMNEAVLDVSTSVEQAADSAIAMIDTTYVDSLAHSVHLSLNDTVPGEKPIKLKEHWIPDPKKALWMAIVIPGGGQIYNRKYWKLPIIYGGFLGCVYALNWNGMMYRDYSQAYIDLMDSSPETNSYLNFLPKTYDIEANKDRLATLFQNKKNFYRRYRDLSFFCIIGVYLLSIVDAYVDAELSSFDIGKDLSMKVRPAIINDQRPLYANTLRSNSYGVKCSLNF